MLLLRRTPLSPAAAAIAMAAAAASGVAIVGGVVLVPSARGNLRALAEVAAPGSGDNRPVLLCGPPGSGKTSALRALVRFSLGVAARRSVRCCVPF
jgi:MoxR-like ATPase